MSEHEIKPGDEHPAGLEDVAHPHSTGLPTTAVSQTIDCVIRKIGSVTAWLWLAVVAVIFTSVIARYAMDPSTTSISLVALEETTWHISSFVWLLGLAYTFVYDQHVRVDILHERLSLKTKTWIEFFGILVLLLPFLVITIYYGLDYAGEAWRNNETAQAPSGLPFFRGEWYAFPYRWFLKYVLVIGLGLLVVAGFSRLLKCTAFLFGFPKPRAEKL